MKGNGIMMQPDVLLPEGKMIEYKANFPADLYKMVKLVVAIANNGGGYLVYGVRESKDGFLVEGLNYDRETTLSRISTLLNVNTIGLKYHLDEQIVDEKRILKIEVEPSSETAFFSRTETSPERQIAYGFALDKNERRGVTTDVKMAYKRVFKYMTLEAFITSMFCKSWRFFEPSIWNDRFEQRFYCANYRVAGAEGNTPQLFATCVTREPNSEAAWKVYSHGQGLGMHCVQLELDVVKLRNEIRESGLQLEEKFVTYESENYITELHKKKSPKSAYRKYFEPFTRASFLDLLSLKRKAYEYEQEIRFFVIQKSPSFKRNTCKKAEHQDIKINWSSVIQKVRIDKNCTPAELVSIQRACYEVGIDPQFKGFSFIPGTSTPPLGAKRVEFSAFNIDEMPGTNKIAIY